MPRSHWNGRTVAVTGGLGFIGSHFVEELHAAGAQVACLYRERPRETFEHLGTLDGLRLIAVDLLDAEPTAAAFASIGGQIDMIVHCAALDGGAQFKLQHSARVLEENVRMTSGVLNMARQHRVPDVVLISSAEVYSGDGTDAAGEDDDCVTHLPRTNSGYAMSKILSEVLADLYRTRFGMNVFLPRPTNVYGPRDNFTEHTNRVVPRMLRALAAGEDIEIWGDGSQTRSFIYVTDLVRSVLGMAEANAFQTMNVATAESVSVLALARLLCEMAGEPERIRFDCTKPSGAARRPLDLTRMQSVPGGQPRNLRAGLSETIRWFQSRDRERPALLGAG
jgi:nucleoside-diphosphate-sugar epimerase